MTPNHTGKRDYHRIGFLFPVDGTLYISDKDMSIDITDLSTKGIKFLFSLDLPLSKERRFLFSFVFEGSSFLVEGRIIRKTFHADDEKIEYGVELLTPDHIEKKLFKLINQHEIRKNKLTRE